MVLSQMRPWGEAEKKRWKSEQRIKRSYQEEIVAKIETLRGSYDVLQYGALSYDPSRYPLYLLKSRDFDPAKKTILITGGVHGYETSGVHGALAFFEREVERFSEAFNFVGAPCLSPWGYETINRWNPETVDPNRSFYPKSPAEECRLFLDAMASLGTLVFAHFDLHETTDTDNTVFRPALGQRDGVVQEVWDIPDGFYLVGDVNNPRPDFQRAIIEEVRKVTHIAPGDASGKIIGVPVEQEGVINYDMKKLFLCGGFAAAEFTTTTEVYPDSPLVTDALCVDAQVAAVRGGVKFLLAMK